MYAIRTVICKMLVTTATREDPDPTQSSLFWVCTVCLVIFVRQLVFEILEHLLYEKLLWMRSLYIAKSSVIYVVLS